jgi:adenine deaminase
MKEVLEQRIDQAIGRTPADLVIRNARILDLVTGELRAGDIAICGERVVGILDSYSGQNEIDGKRPHRCSGIH